MHINKYYDPAATADNLDRGMHREFVGGMWEEIGKLQFEFLRRNGLTPDMTTLDIGCGCLRGGVHFVNFLEPGGYYGIDVNERLLQVGYDIELPEALRAKLPREHLRQTDTFEAAAFGVQFDVALAQSVFTHLPISHLKLCLMRAAAYVRRGGVFHATVFLCPEGHDWSQPRLIPTINQHSHPDRDPFHYEARDIAYAIGDEPWEIRFMGDWGHPRGQSMVTFGRL